MSTEDTRPANLPDLLALLNEPAPPPPVSMAPETAGWWIVGAIALSALGFGLWRAWSGWRRNAYRRDALAALGAAGADTAAIATILRRAALAAFPRREVAGLSGADWIAFLHATGPFPEGAAAQLLRAPYAPGVQAPDLREAAEAWIRGHRRPR
jgi:hypothetical protein